MPRADLYAFATDAGYFLWIGAVILGALVVWATSAVALKTGMLPRWFAWVGVVVGVICLFAIFFIPTFVYWAWILVASLFLLLRPRSRLEVAELQFSVASASGEHWRARCRPPWLSGCG